LACWFWLRGIALLCAGLAVAGHRLAIGRALGLVVVVVRAFVIALGLFPVLGLIVCVILWLFDVEVLWLVIGRILVLGLGLNLVVRLQIEVVLGGALSFVWLALEIVDLLVLEIGLCALNVLVAPVRVVAEPPAVSELVVQPVGKVVA
jgi:hypothetical protein